MVAFFTMAFVIFVITFILFLGSFWLSSLSRSFEKLDAYECGFSSFGQARMKFDILFYLIAILYLIFDLEIIFLFPLSVILFSLGNVYSLFMGLAFLSILTIGFVYEWFEGA